MQKWAIGLVLSFINLIFQFNKMSSSNNVSLILTELSSVRAEVISLKAEVSSLRASLSAKAAVVTAAPADGKNAGKKTRAKNPDAPKREPNAWIVFAKRVRDLLKANGYTEKAVGIECNQFSSSLKDENGNLASWSDADILARRAAWSAPAVSKWVAAHGPSDKRSKNGSAQNSVVSGGDDDGLGDAPADTTAKKARKNPWADLTPEQKAAKVKNMADAKAAKKNGTAPSSSVVSDNAVAIAVTKTEDAPTPVTVSNAAATATTTSSSTGGFRKASVRGSPYLVNQDSGHAYHRMKDGSQGDWAGIFHRNGHPEDNGPWIDDSVAEPSDDADAELVF